MSESRIFHKVAGVTAEGIGMSIQNYLQNVHDLQVQGGRTERGDFVVQAKAESGWKSIVGMDTALEVQISELPTGFMLHIGNAKWSDKIGAGVVGAVVFWPLAATALVGTVQQAVLPTQIFEHVERYIGSAGRLYTGAPIRQRGTHLCPHCSAYVPVDAAFCTKCGQSLTVQRAGQICPNCHTANGADDRFCGTCGAQLSVPAEPCRCPDCDATLPQDAKFCPSCGCTLNPEA